MRPSYVVLILVAAAVAGLAALGPLRGRSVESGFEDVGGAIRSAFSSFGGGTKKATAKAPTPELTVSQPIARKVIEWDEFTGRFAAVNPSRCAPASPAISQRSCSPTVRM